MKTLSVSTSRQEPAISNQRLSGTTKNPGTGCGVEPSLTKSRNERTSPRHAAHLDGSTLQNFAEALANDQIFAGLQHPHANDNGIFPSGKARACRAATGAGIDFDARLALAHFLHDFATGSLDTRSIVGDQEVRNVIGDWRNEDFRFDGWDSR